jgi:hypothetical protein
METDALGTQVSSRPQTTSKTRMAWLVRLLVLVPMMDVRGFEVADDRGGRTPPPYHGPTRPAVQDVSVPGWAHLSRCALNARAPRSPGPPAIRPAPAPDPEHRSVGPSMDSSAHGAAIATDFSHA